jgi:predicted signal transduction protein with EAL and GGDEF domain
MNYGAVNEKRISTNQLHIPLYWKSAGDIRPDSFVPADSRSGLLGTIGRRLVYRNRFCRSGSHLIFARDDFAPRV